MARNGFWPLGAACVGAVVLGLASPGCLERHEAPAEDPDVARCTSCHGDPERAGDYVLRSAPPKDLLGQSEPGYFGVGAHQIHLNASATHAAFPCTECHVVPDSVEAPGHADDARPADVTFGPIAKTGGLEPYYSEAPRTCINSHCHGDGWPVWSEPRTSAEACGSCHGLPPPAPHPQSENCSVCHGEVIDADRQFIAPARHVDGIVDYDAGDCQQCHGGDENPAPPLDTLGNFDVTAIGVGAHQAHLSGGASSRPLACNECHRVPESVEEPTHADGLPAEVTLSGIAATMGIDAAWDHGDATCSAFCHSPSPDNAHPSPPWNGETPLTCTTCHGAPPPLPHPQSTTCSACHGDVVDDDNHTIIDRLRHVNGTVDVAFEGGCTSCHGDVNAAPPLDTEGNRATTAPGVGAHQTHVVGTGNSRPVPCGECHVVPRLVLAAGHVDSALPAELVFSDVALAGGATPMYENGRCSSTSCHGAVFPQESGGTNTEPRWNRVDGTEAACGSCHGLPPPPPHPLASPEFPCNYCHMNVAADDTSFVYPELHVDGIITLAVP